MRARRLTLTLAVATATGVLAAGSGAAWATAAQEGDPRVRDLEFRVRDLTYRTNSIDNSERVEETPDQVSVALAADVLFEYGKADLTAAANAKLDDLAAQLSELGPRDVTIEGHTDSDGEDAANLDLSTRRAQAVETALTGRLESGFNFAVTGKGEAEPISPNQNQDGSDNPDGRALNRRVEITFPT